MKNNGIRLSILSAFSLLSISAFAQNVGIGIATPAEKLHLYNGSMRIETNPGQNSIVLTQAGVITDNTAGNSSRFITSIGGTWYWGAGKPLTGLNDYIIYNYINSRPDLTILNSNGNFGIGTTTPSEKLHIYNGSLRIETNPAQNSIVMTQGSVIADDLAVNTPRFITSIGGTWYWGAGKTLSGDNNYHIYNYPNARTDLTILNSNGNFGIGITSPSEKLHIYNGSLRIETNPGQNSIVLTQGGVITNDDAGGTSRFVSSIAGTWYWGAGKILSADNNYRIYNYPNSRTDFSIVNSNGNVGIGVTTATYKLHLNTDDAAKPLTGTWTVPSDERLKTNIKPFKDGLDVLNRINPVWFEYNGKAEMPTGIRAVGVLAQEMQTTAPYMVRNHVYTDSHGTVDEYLDYNPNSLFYILVNSVKELSAAVDALQNENEILKAEIGMIKSINEALAERMDALERKSLTPDRF